MASVSESLRSSTADRTESAAVERSRASRRERIFTGARNEQEDSNCEDECQCR